MPADPVLSARVLDRLNKVPATRDDTWKLLVLAALESDQALAKALEQDAPVSAKGKKGKSGKTVTNADAEAGTATPEPRVAYLRSIAVEAFRGVGKKVALELP